MVHHGLREEFTDVSGEVEHRWAQICGELEERYAPVACASEVRPRRSGYVLTGATEATEPSYHDGIAEIESGWWVGQLADGSVVTFTSSDWRPIGGDGEYRFAGFTELNVSRYASVDATLMGIAEASVADEYIHQLTTAFLEERVRPTASAREYREAVEGWDAHTADPKRYVRPRVGALIAQLVPTRPVAL